MAFVCPFKYPKTNETEYMHYFNKYQYPLHDFQKWSVEGIVKGQHVLVTAPTGSGKTFAGEFAIEYFSSIGKKVVYTSPIKALSNEKFHNFSQKFPGISVGLITGDIKTNPDANVLIMTTEILLNKLYQLKSRNPMSNSAVSFEMDIESELGCVVFDEIHMINDDNRGHVWEQSIMMLPSHIQIVGLSATLDDPEKFAGWLGVTKGGDKQVYLTKKLVRAVPLIHYSFITVHSGINKSVKDKALREEINSSINKLVVIQDENGQFKDQSYQNVSKMLKIFEKNQISVKRQHVINKVSEYLVQHEMLPALCYVFSRRQLEKCAEELTTNLLEFDSKVPYTVERECQQIVRKLPNFEEYLSLPEYVNMVKLLQKGVGIHHAGMSPILREMNEIMFSRGFIKILFCTETMSVGINLPVKTTIFTDVNKFNGDINRTLYSHEYTQAAGRAGRLGLDIVGHVIHLNNIFRPVDGVSYKNMMSGKPPVLVSKFKISYNLMLNLIDIGDKSVIEKSLITIDINDKLYKLYNEMKTIEFDIENSRKSSGFLRTPICDLERYVELLDQKPYAVNKKRKEIDREIEKLQYANKFIDSDKIAYMKTNVKQVELKKMQEKYDELSKSLGDESDSLMCLLTHDGFVERNEDKVVLTNKGIMGLLFREVHCMVFVNLINNGFFDELSSVQLACLFSCFTSITINDDCRDHIPKSDDEVINSKAREIIDNYNMYKDKELKYKLNTGFEYIIHYDLIYYVKEWCECKCVEDCKLVLQKMESEKQIFLGEFSKAILKINNIVNEMSSVAEHVGNINLLHTLSLIPSLTLKYVVTNQSLYV